MVNPKRRGKESISSTWYRYYPGFSESFARSVLSSVSLDQGFWVLDPWNGSGTTTSTAAALGLNAYGYDLNPAMVIVAKARCLDHAEYPSLKPLAADLDRKAKKAFEVSDTDPLRTWLIPQSVADVRSIEAAIQTLLIDDRNYVSVRMRGADSISDLAAFFYVALFRTLRSVFRPFSTSNPTWLKRPTSLKARLRPSGDTLRGIFKSEISKMLPKSVAATKPTRAERILRVASSEKLPLPGGTVDFVLASPPYCTRIDYAVATSAELSLLGFALDLEFKQLRRELIGSATVPKLTPEISNDWGESCLTFLRNLRAHASKASATYYYKNHLQYFHAMAASISEIGRVLSPEGKCVLVAQDSYYKDLHNDLPSMLTEMASLRNLALEKKYDFPLSRTLAGVNPGSKGYRTSFGATESVLTFRKMPTKGTAAR